ncbi:DUF4913 domain-containing protein [Pseudarthrobacter sp. NPDC092424]|uniref:DUF4913 domain-containing protein n=1 Tax=Pseudarthrobacter sp. NPDC092424 TaxID=3364415 RepID=UPI0037F85AE7
MSEDFGGDAFADEEAHTAEPKHSHGEAAAELVYDNAIEFFAELLAPSYVRDVNEGAELAWCPEWYKHPEALIRMEAMWRSWEHLRLEPALGMSSWWLNHADPHMRVLMDTKGPFKKCAHDNRHVARSADKTALPHAVPERGIFD